MDERGAGSRHVEPQEDPRWFMEQWEQFRALVNTREPKPASPEFLKVQDRVLQLMVANRASPKPTSLRAPPPTRA